MERWKNRFDRGSRISLAVSLLFLFIGTARIASTYRVFSQTWDEPYSVSCGMEWLEDGTYTLDPKHPPLGRVATAALLYARGVTSSGVSEPLDDGNAILGVGEQYRNRLTAARLGVLPFFLIAGIALWVWSYWSFGAETAAVSVLLFSSLPAILGHAGMAMTDVPAVATLTLAILSLCLWLNRFSLARSALLGVAAGTAILTKFTAIPFLAVCGILLTAARAHGSKRVFAPAPRIASGVLIALCAAAGVILAGYQFTIDPLSAGLTDLWHHNRDGQPEFFLGQIRTTGWIYYYPIVFLVKSPLAFLALSLVGMVSLFRRGIPAWPWSAVPAALFGIFAAGTLSHVSEGIRHMLAAYVPLSMLAAFGAVFLFRAGAWGRILAIALCAWHLYSSAAAHPDYLAYFNEAARSKGEAGFFGVDSDLDWGQGLGRLSAVFQRHGIESVWFAYNGTADFAGTTNLPDAHPLDPRQPESGWIAISINKLTLGEPDDYQAYSWLSAYQPVERVGKSILLYYIPPGA